MKSEIHDLSLRLLLGIFNGLYQGILLTLVVAGLLRLMGRTNAASRHAAWLITLLLVALIVPAHCLLDSAGVRELPSADAAGVNLLTSPQPAPAGSSSVENAEQADFTSPDSAGSLTGPVSPSDVENASEDSERIRDTESAAPNLQRGTLGSLASRLPAAPGSRFSIARVVGKVLSGIARPASLALMPEEQRPMAGALVGLVAVLASWRLLLLLYRVRGLRKLTDGSVPAGRDLQDVFKQLQSAIGVTRKVDLRISDRQRSPLMVGFWRPVVLLPADTAENLADARQVVSHELAHVGRYDDWVNLGQHFLQSVLFFHPAVWWIGRRLSLEREIACDDQVLQLGTGRKSYALVLATVACRIAARAPLLAPGVLNNHSQLQQRISMILNTRRNSSPSLARGRVAGIVAATTFLAILSLYAGPRAVVSASVAPATSVAISAQTSPRAPLALAVSPSVSVDLAPETAATAAEPTPSADVAPAINEGPKVKPETPAEIVEPPQPPAPDDPSMAADDRIAHPPRMVRAGKAGRLSRPPELSDAFDGDEGSIEQRLKRLEKMVRSLLDEKGAKRSRGMVYMRDGGNENLNMDEQQLEKLKQNAERQAARAVEQAQKAAEEVKRSNRNFESRLDGEGRVKGEWREGMDRQLDALRKAREGLSEEMEKLSRQIEKLERQQQHGEKEPQKRGDIPLEKLQADNLPEPEMSR